MARSASPNIPLVTITEALTYIRSKRNNEDPSVTFMIAKIETELASINDIQKLEALDALWQLIVALRYMFGNTSANPVDKVSSLTALSDLFKVADKFFTERLLKKKGI